VPVTVMVIVSLTVASPSDTEKSTLYSPDWLSCGVQLKVRVAASKDAPCGNAPVGEVLRFFNKFYINIDFKGGFYEECTDKNRAVMQELHQ
jgi:hypothetical protein